MSEKSQDPERVLRVAREKDRKSPHYCQRYDCSFQRMGMDIRHLQWLRTFKKNDRPMRTTSKSSRLPKKPAICERHREISVRLSFDDNAGGDQIITDIEVADLDVKLTTVLRKF
jgi:hypothetical protein